MAGGFAPCTHLPKRSRARSARVRYARACRLPRVLGRQSSVRAIRMPPMITQQARAALSEPVSDAEPPPEWTKNETIQAHLAARATLDVATPLVIQFGSENCALCPKATLDIDAAQNFRSFEWQYHDATTSELAEELEVTALPAMLVFHDLYNYTLYQKLRGLDIKEVIEEQCPPRLVIDADF